MKSMVKNEGYFLLVILLAFVALLTVHSFVAADSAYGLEETSSDAGFVAQGDPPVSPDTMGAELVVSSSSQITSSFAAKHEGGSFSDSLTDVEAQDEKSTLKESFSVDLSARTDETPAQPTAASPALLTSAELPALVGYALISGDTKVGSTLVAGVEDVPAGAILCYQWYRDDDPIAGATSNTYTTTDADANHEISCRITAEGYRGILISGSIKPVALIPYVEVQYWGFTNDSSDEYVLVHAETGYLNDTFNRTYDQNVDADNDNDCFSSILIGWWDATFSYFYYSNALEDDREVTIGQIAEQSMWNGFDPIAVYAEYELRQIKVVYDCGDYGNYHDVEQVLDCYWDIAPTSVRGFTWLAHRLVGVYDDLGNELNNDMTCGYILSELLDDVWADTINIHYKWEALVYGVSFIFPNGTCIDQEVGYTDRLCLPNDGTGFVYPSYEFVGWFTEPDGGGKQVEEGIRYSALVPNDSIQSLTLYAYFSHVASLAPIAA